MVFSLMARIIDAKYKEFTVKKGKSGLLNYYIRRFYFGKISECRYMANRKTCFAQNPTG